MIIQAVTDIKEEYPDLTEAYIIERWCDVVHSPSSHHLSPHVKELLLQVFNTEELESVSKKRTRGLELSRPSSERGQSSLGMGDAATSQLSPLGSQSMFTPTQDNERTRQDKKRRLEETTGVPPTKPAP